jgi:hypothetical protein
MELGSLSKVIDDDIERRLGQGIRHRDAERLAREIERADLDAEKKRLTEEELEAARQRSRLGAPPASPSPCRGPGHRSFAL